MRYYCDKCGEKIIEEDMDEKGRCPDCSWMINFQYKHLPENLAQISLPFYNLALEILESCTPGRQRNLSLTLLLQSKDAAVRSAL